MLIGANKRPILCALGAYNIAQNIKFYNNLYGADLTSNTIVTALPDIK